MSASAPARARGGVVGLMLRELELCAVTHETTVLVYTDGLGRAELASGFSTAAQLLGASVLELTAPPPSRPTDEDGPAKWWSQTGGALTRTLALADLVIDVSGGGLFHAGQDEILAAGARILRAREPLGRLEALFPRQDVVAHVKSSAALLAGSGEVRFTSSAGTDLKVRTAGQPVTAQWGYTDTPGRWDHWGTALAALAPAEGEGEGVYVLAPGDVVFFTATIGRYVREPLRIEFRGGSVSSIEGGIEAQMLNDLLERSGEADARRLSHLGWGCDPRADWNALELYGPQGGGGGDLRSVHGGVVIAFGANLDLGGTSDSSVHVDLAARAGNVAVDGEPVLCEAGFLRDDLKLGGR
ncbi:MAG: M29 family metallopeptidase [Solirubrobacteraceae bacterium]